MKKQNTATIAKNMHLLEMHYTLPLLHMHSANLNVIAVFETRTLKYRDTADYVHFKTQLKTFILSKLNTFKILEFVFFGKHTHSE